MGMTIAKPIQTLEYLRDSGVFPFSTKEGVLYTAESIDAVIETMRKYQMFQLDYEARLKADMAAMLTDIQLEIEEKVDNRDFMTKKIQEIIQSEEIKPDDDLQSGYNLCLVDICNSIQQKIDKLRGDENEQ